MFIFMNKYFLKQDSISGKHAFLKIKIIKKKHLKKQENFTCKVSSLHGLKDLYFRSNTKKN